jgi:hypothetical protein
LIQAIEHAAELEGRSSLEFTEVIRCQNLRAIARLSSEPIVTPPGVDQQFDGKNTEEIREKL